MRSLAPHIAITAVLVGAAIALHVEHNLAYAAVAAVILGCMLFSSFGASAGFRAGVLFLLFDALFVPFYGRAQMVSVDVSIAMIAFFIVAVRFRIKRRRWLHEQPSDARRGLFE